MPMSHKNIVVILHPENKGLWTVNIWKRQQAAYMKLELGKMMKMQEAMIRVPTMEKERIRNLSITMKGVRETTSWTGEK